MPTIAGCRHSPHASPPLPATAPKWRRSSPITYSKIRLPRAPRGLPPTVRIAHFAVTRLPPACAALAIRRAAFMKCGEFDESLRRAEDLELMLRLFAHATAAAVEEPLSVYCKHGSNLTADETACVAAERRVWRAVIGAPERYGHGLERALAKALPAKIRNDGIRALRQGRFTDAVADLGEAAALGDMSAAWVCSLARAANSRAGRMCYPRLRSALQSFRALRKTRPASP